MLDGDAFHWEVGDLSGRQRCVDPGRGRRSKAVGLVEGNPALGELSAPCSCPHAFCCAKWRHTQALDEAVDDGLLCGPDASPDLLDRDCAHPWLSSCSPERGHSARGGAASEGVDQYRRVEQQPRHLSRAPGVAATLCPHPRGRVVIPLMPRVWKGTEGAFDVVPSLLVVEPTADELCDERAAATGPDPAI